MPNMLAQWRDYPVVHSPVDAPLCASCRQFDLEFFDPSCPGCREILVDSETTVAQVLACMRQWVPQNQRSIDLLIEQILQRGAHPNDRDGLTDLTLLHFACRAGASGVGDESAATRAVMKLLSRGADVRLTCKWTQLSSLHYAAYFDAAAIVHLLLETVPGIDINASCGGYDGGTALHIAASNLCLETSRVLLRHGAKLTVRDSRGRLPKDCVPDASDFENIPHIQEVISTMKRLLTMSEGSGSVRGKSKPVEPVSGRALLSSMGLSIGGHVVVAGVKTGTLRFCGTTEFAVGLWMGVELDTPEGKNDGSVHGITYFKCRPSHGLFVPIDKISKLGGNPSSVARHPSIKFSTTSPKVKHRDKVDLSKVTSKIKTGLTLSKLNSPTSDNDRQFKDGDRVLIGGKRKATVRYYGQTRFAPGNWYGLELDKGGGRNDGAVQGVRYFSCPPNRGVFASPPRVTRLMTASEECLSSGDGSSSAGTRTLSSSPDPESHNNNKAAAVATTSIRRNRLRTSFQVKSPNKSPRTVNFQCQTSALSSSSSPLNGRKADHFRLNKGMTVLVNNELGTVRYMGYVDFAEGLWIGVELKQPRGKNNGTVQGKQYFLCKANHGLLVRPHKVTIHGISGTKLLPESLLDAALNGGGEVDTAL